MFHVEQDLFHIEHFGANAAWVSVQKFKKEVLDFALRFGVYIGFPQLLEQFNDSRASDSREDGCFPRSRVLNAYMYFRKLQKGVTE
jgi:hypothetical protein